MSTQELWINTETALWDVTNLDEPTLLRHISLLEVREQSVGVHTFLLSGRMPLDGTYLLALSEDHAFEVHWSRCCSLEEYDEDSVVLRFVDCKVLQRWVEDIVISSPSNASVVNIFVLLQGDARWFFT